VGSLVDIDAGQVSLASPIGQALLGREAGDVVTVHTPERERRFEIINVTTIREFLEYDPILATYV
ncbi:MAG: GreA/GreB family elongation factor, partial [Gemmatimonadota bacterium]